MKKIIASGLISMILLSSCGKATETAVTTNEKELFSIETKTITDFPTSYTIKKTGRMVGSSNIALASQ